MKIPFIEIIPSAESTLLFLIEHVVSSDEQEELISNYHKFWNVTNDLILALERQFKFESLNSLSECIEFKKEAQKLYKFRVLDKGNGSIYSNLIHDPEYDYTHIIYDEGDKPIQTANMSFTQIVAMNRINQIIEKKQEKDLGIEILPTKPGKGQKSCKGCKRVIGARSNSCKYCGYNYK